MTDTLLSSIECNRLESIDSIKQERSKHLAMTCENVDLSTLSTFLERYCPFQLLVDRRKASNRIGLQKRLLSVCSLLETASDVVAQASASDGSVDVKKLEKVLYIDKRSTLPHPLWTTRHDAILIQAIAKHGWINQSTSCREITNDPTIKWGAPFESAAKKNDDTAGSSGLEDLVATSKRAAHFLNAHHHALEEIKGFNQNLVVRTYGLVRLQNGEGHAQHKWTVDVNQLQPSQNEADDQELPTKKDLVKRAKIVLTKTENAAASSDKKSPEEPLHDYAVLDQSERCNIYLAEIMRGALKTPASSKFAKTLYTAAIHEARKRVEETSFSGGSSSKTDYRYLTRVWEQLQFVKQNLSKGTTQSKNVIRVMLGEEPVKPKNAEDSLFPKGKVSSLALRTVEPARAKPRATSRSARSAGETAIATARKRLKDRYSSPDKFASLENTAMLELTEIETLLLSMLCAYGLPTSLDERKSSQQLNGRGDGNLTWRDVGHKLSVSARVELEKSEKLLLVGRETHETEDMGNQGLLELLELEKDVRTKEVVVVQAEEYMSEPETLAKKALMLVAKVRQQFGVTSISAFTERACNGLGNRIVVWLDNEVASLARALDLLDNGGKPLGFTAVDFIEDVSAEDRAKIQLSSMLDKKGSRQIIAQIAMLTRLRDMSRSWGDDKMSQKIETVVKRLVDSREVWENEPHWWRPEASSNQNDKVLVDQMVCLGLTDDLLDMFASVGVSGPLGCAGCHQLISKFSPYVLLSWRTGQ